MEPTTPPLSNRPPIFTSRVLRFQWARAPEKEEATIWGACVDTATVGGMPMNIRIGVIRKPPPTPNKPDRNPIPPPNPSNRKMLTEISAMGR